MRNMIMLVVVLTVVCVISALSLGVVNNITASRIAEQNQKAKLKAITSALPKDRLGYDNDPSRDIAKISEWIEKDGTPKEIYLAKQKGKIVGIAFTSSGEGYGGFINIMMGIDPNEKITGIEIIAHLETPGLGSKIESPELFKDQFYGKSTEGSENGELVVVKGRKADKNWEIEALTGATISPSGVVKAINDGLAKFRQYKDQILGR
jgi:electron transport complex protein RnfG